MLYLITLNLAYFYMCVVYAHWTPMTSFVIVDTFSKEYKSVDVFTVIVCITSKTSTWMPNLLCNIFTWFNLVLIIWLIVGPFLIHTLHNLIYSCVLLWKCSQGTRSYFSKLKSEDVSYRFKIMMMTRCPSKGFGVAKVLGLVLLVGSMRDHWAW